MDNAWLGVALTMVANSQPDLRVRARKLLEPMDFRFFYDPYDAADPVDHPGQLHVGYRPGERRYYGHYGMLNSEARIASYLAIARGQLPPEHYYRMFRTLPQGLTAQSQIPRGDTRKYLGIPVFEGHYDHLGARIVPSWGGSMFEALMVTLFVPEDRWAPNSWGMNHPLYVQAQIEAWVAGRGLCLLGFLPRGQPAGRLPGLRREAAGNLCPGLLLPRDRAARSGATGPSFAGPGSHGGHSRMPRSWPCGTRPTRRSPISGRWRPRFRFTAHWAFKTRSMSRRAWSQGCILTLDQGMIMAAIANALADDAIQHFFSDGPVERKIRPLIALEEFTTGPPGQLVEAHPAANGGHDSKAKAKSAP